MKNIDHTGVIGIARYLAPRANLFPIIAGHLARGSNSSAAPRGLSRITSDPLGAYHPPFPTASNSHGDYSKTIPNSSSIPRRPLAAHSETIFTLPTTISLIFRTPSKINPYLWRRRTN